MIGAIVGDIVGSIYEFDNIKTKEFPLFNKQCFVTDDSIMTFSVAEALMKSNNKEELYNNVIVSMQTIGRNYPNCGYGNRFINWIYSDDPKPYNSCGNGSAMRVSPVSYVVNNLQDAEDYAEIVSSVTHNHPEGIKGAKSVAGAIFLAKNGHNKNEINDYVLRYYNLNFSLNDIRSEYCFNETCQGTVPQAVVAFLESNDFEDAIRNAISIGGDSDTIAAITGSIAEAYYGVPKWIEDRAIKYLDKRLLNIYKCFNEFIKQ